MKYNFDEIISRHGTNSYKWDSAPDRDVLPMWVADMDFRTAPAIVHALQQRVEQGIFGYTRVPDAYYEAVTGWFGRRHGWEIRREWIIYTSGVVPAVSAIIKALTVPGDKVLVQTPVYNCFFSSIRNNGCEVELLRIGEICIRNGVTVVSDEIHCELVYPGHTYIPFASLSEEFLQHSITCISPSKSFNMAGLQIANIVAADENMRRKIDKAININEVCDVNPFGVIATITAYNECEEWLAQLLDYLEQNYLCMKEFCQEYLPDFPVTVLEGTYLVWMDCRALHKSSEELERLLVKDAKLWLNAGTMYGAEGEGFMRWNIACPRPLLIKGLKRFRNFVYNR